MSQHRICRRKFGRSALTRATMGAVLAAVVVYANTGPARAGDDDEDSPSVMSRLMRAIGLKDPSATYDGINYSERSPLVVPPTRDLPPPVAAGAPPAPDWPKDPDVERRAQDRAQKKPKPQKDTVIENARPLRPDELNAGVPRSNNPADATSTANSQQTDPVDHGAKKNIFSSLFHKSDEYTAFTGEPARSTLTDPPPGYLTPSPDEPYGVGEAKKTYKIPTLADRVEAPR